MAIWALGIVAYGAPAHAAPEERAASSDLDQLMQLLAARQHGRVDFVEQHFLKVLKRPVESSGELFYDAPDRLEKRTLEPRPETLLLAGDLLTIERGAHTRVLDLKSYPAVLPFVESMRATLAGDLGALARLFSVEYAGSLAHWMLNMTPRDSQVAKTVSQVRIEGAQDRLLRVEILERDGDRSLMTLRDHPGP
jgi:Outer membrane lipoprotein carrier protein LolA-like